MPRMASYDGRVRPLRPFDSAGPTFQLNVVTRNGTMYGTMAFVEPAISCALGQAVADATLANLKEMAEIETPA